jgi:hypothetical protein
LARFSLFAEAAGPFSFSCASLDPELHCSCRPASLCRFPESCGQKLSKTTEI